MNDHFKRARLNSAGLYTAASGSTPSNARSEASNEAAESTALKMRKRSRISCTECRKQKIKCDNDPGLAPSQTPLKPGKRCLRCIRLNLDCVVWSGPRAPTEPAERPALSNSRAGSSGASHSPVEFSKHVDLRGHNVHGAMAINGSKVSSANARYVDTSRWNGREPDSEEDELEANTKEIYPAGDLHIFHPITVPERTGSQSATPGDSAAEGAASAAQTPKSAPADVISSSKVSALGSPFALLAQLCFQESAFGVNLRRGRPDPEEVEILTLIDAQTSVRLEQQ